MFTAILVIASMFQVAATTRTDLFIPTSELLRVARMAARDEGFPTDKIRTDGARVFFFDIATNAEGKPLAAGYVRMSFYGNSHLIRTYSVNEQTGQIVDIENCATFDFPNLQAFARETQKESGSKPESREAVAQDVGCETLVVINRPFARKPK